MVLQIGSTVITAKIPQVSSDYIERNQLNYLHLVPGIDAEKAGSDIQTMIQCLGLTVGTCKLSTPCTNLAVSGIYPEFHMSTRVVQEL